MKFALRLPLLLVAAVLALTLAPEAGAQRKVAVVDVENPRSEPWPDEVVEAFARIPVQDRGRVKPLSTFAGFRMLNMNGKRKYEIPDGTKLPTAGEELDPTRWLLDVLLYRDQARHYEIFVVTDKAVLDEIGVKVEGRKRRDRYSYLQLRPGRMKLEQAAQRLDGKDRNERTRLETQLLDLRAKLIEYDLLELMLESLVTTLGDQPSARLLELFPEGANGAEVPLGTVLSRWDTVRAWMDDAQTDVESDAVRAELGGLALGVDAALARAEYSLALVPPDDADEEVWRSPGAVALDTFRMGAPNAAPVGEGELELIDAFAAIWHARGDLPRAGEAIVAAQEAAQAAATERGEFAKIPLEITYYRGKFFTRALVFFLFAFVFVAFSWMRPNATWFGKGIWAFMVAGLGLLVAGVTIRCVLLGRPPVATLYETILFITAIAVAVCLVAERLTKERMVLAIAATLGAAGMFLSMRYEAVEAAQQGDTMGGLVAVLNTNFWLATHVTTVTMGYSAGLLAAALGHVWIALRLGRAYANAGPQLTAEQSAFFRSFGRILYGVLCFGLLFSVVGTILGGVWANDSWGRFWGWDPKENGALMIVLFELAILHARMGGYIRDFGVAVLSVACGAVVAFSWWHVNQLGVGLHSYGFTEGVVGALKAYYAIVAGFVLLSVVGWSMYIQPKATTSES